MLYCRTVFVENKWLAVKLFEHNLLSFLDEADRPWDVKLTPMLKLYSGDGVWMTICHEGINMVVANVVCRQQGFISATRIEISDS